MLLEACASQTFVVGHTMQLCIAVQQRLTLRHIFDGATLR